MKTPSWGRSTKLPASRVVCSDHSKPTPRPRIGKKRLQRRKLAPPRDSGLSFSGGACVRRSVHSLENSLLNLHSVLGDSKVYGCDCYFVPEGAKSSRQRPGAFVLGLGIRFNALLDKSHPLMQDLPDHAAESMCDCPDRGLIAQPGQQTPEHDLK